MMIRSKQTAVEVVQEMISNMPINKVNDERVLTIQYGIDPSWTHPQFRTAQFHRFYDAPIHEGSVTKDFKHMSNERVAFRVSFIISELFELLNKGLGLTMEMSVHVDNHMVTYLNQSDANLCNMIREALDVHGKRDIVEVVDALGDLNVVVNGFALELGVDMNAVDREICASNFTKMGADGFPIIGDGITGPVGKVLKGPNFVEPNIAAVLGLDQ